MRNLLASRYLQDLWLIYRDARAPEMSTCTCLSSDYFGDTPFEE